MNNNFKKEVIVGALGVFFILIGVVFNEWVVAYLLTYDGNLATTPRVLVWALDLVLVLAGIFLIVKRKPIASKIVFSKKNVFAVILLAVLVLGALEGAARIVDWAYDGEFSSITIKNRKARSEEPIIPFRTFGLPYYKKEEGGLHIRSTHDELYPFKKEEGTVRIVAFGGSTTEQIVNGVHYPLRLEKLLQQHYPSKNIEVINVAYAAYATPHSLIALTHDVLSWDADIVILSHNINDLNAAYFEDFRPDYSNKYGHDFYLKPCRFYLCPGRSLFGWSVLYWLADQQRKAFLYRQEVGEDFYKRKSYGNQPPKEAQDVFRRNLETFAIVARQGGMDVIFGTQPFHPSFRLFDLHTRGKPYNDIVTYPLHEEIILHHAYYNTIIRDVANERGAYLVDNEKDFGDKKEYFSDFVHYTLKGTKRIADNYYNVVVESNLIQ